MECPCLHWLLVWAVLVMAVFISGASGLECYSCAYVPGEGQYSCSDPWYSIRDTLNALTGPPRRQCQEACVKIVIETEGSYNSVVRTCGSMCNETVSGNTLMTCCTTDYCNTASQLQLSILRCLTLVLTHCLIQWLLSAHIL